MPKALIVGVNGQDGAYLAKHLLRMKFLEYEVHGVRRHASVPNTQRLTDLLDSSELMRLKMHVGDITDASFIYEIVRKHQFDEVYNLAAQSDVPVSFNIPEYTFRVNTIGTLNLLNAISSTSPQTRFYQASTSELFGLSPAPQDEDTPMIPQSPYAIAKLAAYHLVKQYRDAYGMYAVNGILFNHESPHRGEQFVTAKVCMAAARASIGDRSRLKLGNLDATRDWGHAADYVRGMRMMLHNTRPRDYVLATGKSYTVRQLVDVAYRAAKVPLKWQTDSFAVDTRTNEILVGSDPAHFRPLEVPNLRGIAYKAKNDLGWEPSISFENMIEEMVDAYRERLKTEQPD
jgi:GDPmannose 4,6-dehydratase